MKWFKNLRIRPKLFVSFAIVIAFAVLLAAMAISTLNRIDSSYSYLINFPEQQLQYLLEIDTDCAILRRTLTAVALNAADPETIESNWQEFEQAYGDAMNFIDKYLENNNADTVRDPAVLSANNDLMQNVKKQFETYKVEVEKGLNTARETGDRDASYAIFLDSAPIMTEISSTVNEELPKATAYVEQVRESNASDTDKAIITFIVLLAVIVVLSVLVAVYISWLISKPLGLFTSFMKKAGTTGDITLMPDDIATINEFSEYKDEIGQCVTSTASFVEHMANLSNYLEVVAGGDLTAEFALLSQDDVMGNSLNKMVDKLNSMFGELRTASGQVSAGSGQVSHAAQGLASGATEQAASIEEFTASLSDLEERTKKNAENAAHAREANDKAAKQLTDSGESMSKLMEAMRSIDESSNSITKVIKVIEDIAFQTKILALNAAVEAAHAGQHGKGFAVVAEEVGTLASKSTDAAKETAALIEGSSERVKEGNQIVAQTNGSLEKVLVYAQELAMRVNEVDTASAEQAHAIREIHHGIDQISTVVQANSATAEESAASAQEMSAQAVLLDEIVAKFRLRQEETRRNLTPNTAHGSGGYPAQITLDSPIGKY